MAEVSAAASFRDGALNLNTWFLFIQYACCFGVELTMNNAAALYFKEEFELTTEEAAAIASIFGWMNLFARGLGGYFSDKANARMGMKRRLWTQTIFLLCEGALVLVFANTNDLTGAIAGIIGAGGNTGAVCFGLGFRNLEYKDAFVLMGITILASAGLSVFVCIPGSSKMFWGEDEEKEAKETLEVPDTEKVED